MMAVLMRVFRVSARSPACRSVCTRSVISYAAHVVQTIPDPSKHFKLTSRSLVCAASAKLDATQARSLESKGGGLEELLPTHCCGCGIKLQRDDVNVQGFYVVPKKLQQAYQEGEIAKSPEKVQARPVEADFDLDDDDTSVVLDPIAHTTIVDPYADEQFCDDTLEDGASNKSRSLKAVEQLQADPISKMLQITCARCHKLSFEGRVASSTAEQELPAFDLAATVGAKIARRTARRAVVAVVVDIADFDGSLPRQALLSMLPQTWHPDSKDRLPFDIVLVVNKMDSLPKSVSHGYVENWVRARLKDANLPKPTQVHLVSCVKEIGVKRLVQSLVELVGIQGDLWIIGAQNAGKSSLINAMKYHAGTRDATATLTTAPLPGTTLDMVMVDGLPLMARSRCYDTPGVPHPYQLTSMFGVEEVKQLLARDRPLQPRTYRVGANRTIFVGGICRIDVHDFNYGTIYLTVWASDLIPLHMGKTRQRDDRRDQWLYKADQFWEAHAGAKLNPPGPDSKHLVPNLVPVEFFVEGTETQMAQSDIAIAGLGWVSCGLNGKAKLRVWTPKGVAVTRRRALLPDYAKDFDRPGWSNNSKSLFKYTAAQIEEQRMKKQAEDKDRERKRAVRRKNKRAKGKQRGMDIPVPSPSATI